MSKQSDNKPLKHTGADHSAPYPVSRLAPEMSLVDLAKEIQQAEQMIHSTSHAKLRIIADQILNLKQQARDILEETQKNQSLHHAECQFKKIPGKTYHLYQKANGKQYFSMLSPADWNHQPSDDFQGSFILQADMSWKAADKTDEQDSLIDGLLESL